MTREELREKANDLPLKPGVYLMMDRAGKVIYVGKAKKLKNRVSQYFQDSTSHTVKTRKMVSEVDHFDTIFVSSEWEALVLENSLIKRHSPKYNILLKDDKGYPFVRLSVKEPYPRFTMVHKWADDGARYFGPFGGRFETRQALDAVCAALRLPTCGRKFPRDIGAERPCLNYHMGKCEGWCRPDLTGEEYRARTDQAAALLEGKSRLLLREMTAEMEAAAQALRFEKAAQLRDRINAIGALNKKQTVIAGLCADTDIWGVYKGAKCCYAVLHMEEGNLAGRETSVFAVPGGEDEGEILSAVTAQYYLPRSLLPHEILLPADSGDCEELSDILTQRAGRRVWVHVPRRGEKAELLEMARRNAREEAERATTREERSNQTLHLLGKLMNLPGPPGRMESYDISNTGSSEIVASMVVYHGDRPAKNAYRRFQIREITDRPDDYGSMREVLRRRLQRAADGDEKFLPLPDVFLIDGGAVHAKTALEIVESFGLHIPIFGMVKDERHRTRALVTPQGLEIGIQANPQVFALIGRIQEETHRFAITYNRDSHRKNALKSALDDVPGVGPKRREALRKAFGSLKAVRAANLAELEAVVPSSAAEQVYRHFHPPSGGEKTEEEQP